MILICVAAFAVVCIIVLHIVRIKLERSIQKSYDDMFEQFCRIYKYMSNEALLSDYYFWECGVTFDSYNSHALDYKRILEDELELRGVKV